MGAPSAWRSGARRRGVAVLVAFVALLAPAVAGSVPEGPPYPSAEWAQREAANFARLREEPSRQADPIFQRRLAEQSAANVASYAQRTAADPSFSSAGNPCAEWAGPCVGDPFRYPGIDPFYSDEGEVRPVVFQQPDCGRISGRLWSPRRADASRALPGVVIEPGTLASETVYWWAAQELVRAGYLVLTFDVRGQGRSERPGQAAYSQSPGVFWEGLVQVVDWFRSSPAKPLPWAAGCAARSPSTQVDPHNPLWERLDRERIGVAAHSLGSVGVSLVQGYDPWPGVEPANPIDAVVAWDFLASTGDGFAGNSVVNTPRIPAMGQRSEYSLTPQPFSSPPDPEAHKRAFHAWSSAAVPVYQLTFQASAHYEWSYVPGAPSTSWKTWANPAAAHYTVAWFDRWLKVSGEPGFDDADARLLADDVWRERLSFYFRSARSFPTRSGAVARCDDIRAGGCAVPHAGRAAVDQPPARRASGESRLPATGSGSPMLVGLFGLAAAVGLRSLRRSSGAVRP